MPSEEVAATLDCVLGPPEIATNIPLPYVTERHTPVAGSVAAVQVTPLFMEYAALVPDVAEVTTNVPLPYASPVQFDVDGSEPLVHEVRNAPVIGATPL